MRGNRPPLIARNKSAMRQIARRNGGDLVVAKIHRKYALHQDPDQIARVLGVSLVAVEIALLTFDFRQWIGRQRCAACGEPPGERDRGVLTRYRGRALCHRCLMGPGTSDDDWTPFFCELIDFLKIKSGD